MPSSLGQSYVSVVQSASAPSASNSTEKVEVEITEEGIAEAREEFFKGVRGTCFQPHWNLLLGLHFGSKKDWISR